MLFGCDIVFIYFGIGKGIVLKNFIVVFNLLLLFGCLDVLLFDVVD